MQKSGIIVWVWSQPFFLVHAEIRDNPYGLVSVILPCPYVEMNKEEWLRTNPYDYP
jgi:hypothetical protein